MRLSRKVASYVKRPHTVSMEDAQQDASVILLSIRAKKWDAEKIAHAPAERQEQVLLSWVRLHLIDKYASEFKAGKRTERTEEDLVDAKTTGPSLSGIDLTEIRALVARLNEPRRRVVEMLVFEGRTQVEVAEALGQTQGAVSRMFERARDELAVMLADYRC